MRLGLLVPLPLVVLAVGLFALPGQASHPPLPGSPLEDPRGNALAAFQFALERIEEGALVRIVHLGDSHVAGQAMTGALRRDLQERYGDGGPGLVVPGLPWPRYRRQGVETGGEGWTATRITRATAADGPIGVTGVVMTATEPGATAWVESRSDDVGTHASLIELHYLRAPGGGRMQVVIDGAVRTNLSTASNRLEPGFWTTEVEDGRHRVELIAMGGGAVRVLGLSMTRAAGLVYDALGVNGARFAHWQRADEALMTAELRRDAPALMVTTFGTNETDDDAATTEAHRRAFLGTIAMLRRAAPGASCLVLGPPDRARREMVQRRRVWQTAPSLAAIITAERQAALESGCAFWNTFAAMGGRGTMRRWAMLDPPLAGDDRVHLTSSGYRILAESLSSALLGSR